MEELAAFENNFTKVISENKDKSELLDNLNKQLRELEVKEAQYDTMEEEFKAELKKAKETSAEMNRMNAAWTQEKQTLNEQLGKVQATHNIAYNVNAHFKAKNDQLKNELNQLESEKKQLEHTLRTEEIKKLTIKSKLNHLKGNLDQVVEQIELGEREVKTVKQMSNEVQMKIKEHEMEFEEVVNEYLEVRNDVNRIMNEIETVRKAHSEDKAVCNEGKNEVLDASLQDIADDEQDLIKQLEELRNENARTMKEIIELEKVLTV